MSRKLNLKTVAGLLGPFVLACATAHAQTGQTGGSQTGGGSTGGTQTGGSTGSTGQTGGTGTGGTGSTGSSASGSPIGAATGPAQYMPGAGARTGTGGGATGQAARGTIGGRNNTSTAGRGGRAATSLGVSGGAGRAGSSGQQSIRQTDQRAQYATQIDFAQAVPGEPLRSTTEVRATVQHTLAAVVPSGITASVDGSKVILKGTVASDSDRKLAERIVLLEPGVRSVQNEVLVQGRSSSVQ